MSAFNPAQFLEMQIEGSNATEYVAVPEGEYMGQAQSAEILEWKAADDPSKAGVKLKVVWQLTVPEEVAAEIGRADPTIKQEIFLDLVEGSGALDMGKGRNVQLGRLREALGLNTGAFSFTQIPGQYAKCMVKHRSGKDGQIFAEVKQVARA